MITGRYLGLCVPEQARCVEGVSLVTTTLFDISAIIKQVMEGCGQRCGMAVSLPVAISVGTDWGNMLPYTVDTT